MVVVLRAVTVMNYPLLIDFKGTLFCQGFVAEVKAGGRLVASEYAPDDWWLYGVNPGAIAASGDSLDAAHEQFRVAMREILVRFATEAESFAAFKRETESFFLSTNEPAKADWQVAVDRVRTYKECLGDLPIRSAASRVFVDVIEKKIDQVMPSDNTVSADLAKAAA